ncbi:MAG: cytochrome c oxidase subunit II [Gammaproteobacteria bacterium]|nr:cytochrome c oxidase subunit II [Gammaproteobacteria bacterium]MDE0510225.1 cytochrome c oxidase subunit II [Gammaproteobacteria bacterium]
MSAGYLKTVWGAVISLLALALQPAWAEYGLNMPEGVTPLSRNIYDLHMLIFYICCVIAVVVFGVMFWSIFRHRKSRGVKAAQFHHHTTVEIIWTAIPMIILILMAIPATKSLILIESTGDSDLTIKITGYQWRWHYEYIEEDFGFFSSLAPESNEARQLNSGIDPNEIENYLLEVDNPVVVPVNTKIRFMTTAADVIHSWWVPALGWKRDSIPGFINESWAIIEEEGTYRGQCAELCGRDHAFMPIVLKAVSEDEYYDWAGDMMVAALDADVGADREWAMDELMERGEQVYSTFCVACHQVNGMGIPGAFKPLVGSPITTGPLDGHIDTVMNGVAGTAMAPFGMQLNDVDIASVITYERNSWGNDLGDMVQPSMIADRR